MKRRGFLKRLGAVPMAVAAAPLIAQSETAAPALAPAVVPLEEMSGYQIQQVLQQTDLARFYHEMLVQRIMSREDVLKAIEERALAQVGWWGAP